MQLGTRWPFGQEPPARVPDELRAPIAAHEAASAGGGHWTLTWLEGRAIVEAEDGTVLRSGGRHHGDADADSDEW